MLVVVRDKNIPLWLLSVYKDGYMRNERVRDLRLVTSGEDELNPNHEASMPPPEMTTLDPGLYLGLGIYSSLIHVCSTVLYTPKMFLSST